MRLLIDGYNVMHAAGRMRRRFGPDGLRRARLRFLNELAILLGPERAKGTTIVFDATSLPLNQATETIHKGMKVIYAIEDDDADARIEFLIARDSAPRSLTVVSSDRRIRRAAQRRRSISQTADDFLDSLESFNHRSDRQKVDNQTEPEPYRHEDLSPEQVEAWVLEFDLPGRAIESTERTPMPSELWTDEDLQEIVREVEAEFRHQIGVIHRLPRR